MKLIRLTPLSCLFIVVALGFISCEKDSYDKDEPFEFSKSGIALSGAQETPPVPSTATGTMDVFYSRETKLLSYKVTWVGLADSVSGMHIHGLAPIGFAAPILQNIVASSGSVFPQKTAGKFTFAKSGTLSGSLLVDGVLIKEEPLMNGLFYLNIHNATYPGGEIRGQITF
ncbi:MAG: CHRD domain-containing protein [Ginsengibacter sp.]